MEQVDFSGINQQIMEDKLKTPDVIYIDLSIIKDLFLGTILSMIKTKEQYDIIMTNLKIYEGRYIDNIEHALPKLGITQEQYLEHRATISDFKLFQISPITEFINVFSNFVTGINNKRAVMQKISPIQLYINVYPLNMPRQALVEIANIFQNTFAMNTSILIKPITDYALEFIHKIDMFFMEDIKSFMENDIIKKEMVDKKFNDTLIYAPRRIGDLSVLTEIHKTEENLMKDFIVTETYIRFMCMFSYLPSLKISINK